MSQHEPCRYQFSQPRARARRTLTMGVSCIGLLLVLLLPGCDGGKKPSPAKNRASAHKTPAGGGSAGAANPKPKAASKVPADAFPNLDAAIESLKTAAKASDTEAFVRAEQWIVMQGDAGVEPLGKILNDQQAELEHRIAVCRTLRRLGPKAKAPFQQALHDKSQQIQLNAIKGLGLIEPTDKDTIETLKGYLDHKEPRYRTEALFALANIGPPAQEAVEEKLIGMLNDMQENETVRGAAKKALDEVAPRRTFVDR